MELTFKLMVEKIKRARHFIFRKVSCEKFAWSGKVNWIGNHNSSKLGRVPPLASCEQQKRVGIAYVCVRYVGVT